VGGSRSRREKPVLRQQLSLCCATVSRAVSKLLNSRISTREVVLTQGEVEKRSAHMQETRRRWTRFTPRGLYFFETSDANARPTEVFLWRRVSHVAFNGSRLEITVRQFCGASRRRVSVSVIDGSIIEDLCVHLRKVALAFEFGCDIRAGVVRRYGCIRRSDTPSPQPPRRSIRRELALEPRNARAASAEDFASLKLDGLRTPAAFPTLNGHDISYRQRDRAISDPEL
jgi:hypothetical protein